MKTLQISFMIVLIALSTYAQNDTIFLDDSWQKTDSELATYYRIVYNVDSFINIKDYDKLGNILMEGQYNCIDPEIENGHFIFYNEKEIKVVEGSFNNGQMVNKWIYYNKKGKRNKILDYNKLPKTDSNLVYSELEKYFSENPIVLDMPVFNNGDISFFSSYLSSNFNLPPILAKYDISGRVFVQFIVDKNGDMVNVIIHRSIHPHVDCEIKRIIANAPKWRPAVQNGKNIAIPITIPFDVNK